MSWCRHLQSRLGYYQVVVVGGVQVHQRIGSQRR